MRKSISTINVTFSLPTPPSPQLPPPPSMPRSNSFQHSMMTAFFPFRRAMLFIPPLPILDSVFDVAILSCIAAVLFLSILSLLFIFLLRLKSRSSYHLQNFSSLWTVRFLLVSFVSLWAINELLRLPFFRLKYLCPLFSHSLSFSQQADLCKIHVLLSLGIFEPGFLITILFLVNVSIKKKNPHDRSSIAFVFASSLPVFLLQVFFLFFSPAKEYLPEVFHQSSVIYKDSFSNDTVLCTYPLFSSIVFGAFGIVYALVFLFSCWRVVSLVINKGLRVRIYGLAFGVLIPLPIQILFLCLSVLWRPEEASYSAVALVVFLSVLISSVAGEGILVIKPILDALDAGGDCCRWIPGCGPRWPEVGGKRLLIEGE